MEQHRMLRVVSSVFPFFFPSLQMRRPVFYFLRLFPPFATRFDVRL
jgi:hypothetical protein